MSTEHFSDAELSCHDGCGKLPPQSFQDKLENFRVLIAKPLRISSGARCSRHNMLVSKTGPNGPHTIGAVDILCHGVEAYDLLDAALHFGWTGIGIQQTGPLHERFIHLDEIADAAHPRPTIWSYA